jgi:transposase
MERIGPHGLVITRVASNGRRSYDPASRDRLVEACFQPGASLAGLALAHGVNANVLHKWVLKRRRLRCDGAQAGTGVSQLSGPGAFVRVEPSPVLQAPRAGSLTLQPAQSQGTPRLQATMPNGVTLSLDGCDPQLLAVMIDALGRA